MTTVGNVARRPDLRSIALAALIVAMLLVIHLHRPGGRGLWYQTFFDALHAPVFGIIALGVNALLARRSAFSAWRRLAAVAGIVILLAFASEAAQIPLPRDASWHDIVTDVLGATGFLLLALGSGLQARPPGLRPAWFLLGGATALVVALLPLITVSAAYVERRAQLPAIVRPAALFDKTFWRRQNARVTSATLPGAPGPGLRVTLGKGAWPGIVFHDIWPDWRGYDRLAVVLGNDSSESLTVHFRVHDRLHRLHDQPYSDRYNRSFEVAPGITTWQIPLEEIASAPAARRLDLAEIDGLALFTDTSAAGRTFHLLSVRLELAPPATSPAAAVPDRP